MKIAVSGVYQSKFGELWHKSLQDLTNEALNGVLKDSGVIKEDVQAVYIGNMLADESDYRKHMGGQISEYFSHNPSVYRLEAACASGGIALNVAVNAIQSGQVDNALVIGIEKMTDVDGERINQAIMMAGSEEEYTAGLTFPGLYALMANEYLRKYKASERDLAKVVVKNHYHAQFNKLHAQFPFAITQNQVIHSPKVADPLKILDCSPISDGVAAVFLASSKWVKQHFAQNGVYLTASQVASDSLSLSKRKNLTSLLGTQIAAKNAYQQAGVGVDDIDCAEVHDCFSIAEILALEDLGFYPQGEAIYHLTEKEVYLGGKRPINTSGGLKACGHPLGATGVKQVVEVTWQLRGQATDRQIKNPKIGLTHNVGGTGGTVAVHILQN